jgi:hypothetical protein
MKKRLKEFEIVWILLSKIVLMYLLSTINEIPLCNFQFLVKVLSSQAVFYPAKPYLPKKEKPLHLQGLLLCFVEN